MMTVSEHPIAHIRSLSDAKESVTILSALSVLGSREGPFTTDKLEQLIAAESHFRMLLRHIYRQQRFWGGIADQQHEGEQHACLLQFLGLAERLFTEQFGQLIKLKKEVDQLKVRRD